MEGRFPGWPRFDEDEVAVASWVLRSGRVNYWTGGEGRGFEREFAQFAGSRYAVAVANGTLALELALRGVGVGPGVDVVVPSRTFFATASAVVAVGARPVFADVDRDSGNVTAETISRVLTDRTAAILVVHLGGWPCEMDPILALARKRGPRVVEDCAQACGAFYRGKSVGTLGDAGAFSFCQDKNLTTAGEGGMVVTDREEVWREVWSYRDHGRRVESHVSEARHGVPTSVVSGAFQFVRDGFGTNARLTEVQAAVGRVQLRKLPEWTAIRRRNAAYFSDRLEKLPGLRVAGAPEWMKSAPYRFYAYMGAGFERDRVLEVLAAEGVPCGVGSCGEVYLERAFADSMRPADRFPVARELAETSLAFPVHPALGIADIDRMCEAVERAMAGGARVWPVPPPVARRRDLAGRVVMVTGAAGSIGTELSRQIVRLGAKKLICVDRAETPLFQLEHRVLAGTAVEIVYSLADVTDAAEMRGLMRRHGVEAIVHAAAFKHVPMTEANPAEALRNNVFGLLTLIEAADACGCEDFVLISSDKAVNPASLMGCTKRIGELIVASRPSAMRCFAVRFGNVLGSQGSVVPIFEEQARSGGALTVTHPEMSRYFMTVAEAGELTLQAFAVGEPGDVLVFEMGEPVRIVDLARRIAAGIGVAEPRIVFTGVRPGEKLAEELYLGDEEGEPTGVARVRRARREVPEWERLRAEIDELRGVTETRDGARIRAAVKCLVPEYRWTAEGLNSRV